MEEKNAGRILLAKGAEVKFDLVDGEKTFKLIPLINEQLIEIQSLATEGIGKDQEKEEKYAMKALIRLSVHSLNNGLPEGARPFTDKDIEKSSTPILLEIFDKAVTINKLEKVFDFQKRGLLTGHPTLRNSQPGPSVNTLADLNKRPRKVVPPT